MRHKKPYLVLFIILGILIYVFISVAIIDNMLSKETDDIATNSGEVKLYVTEKDEIINPELAPNINNREVVNNV